MRTKPAIGVNKGLAQDCVSTQCIQHMYLNDIQHMYLNVFYA